MNVNKTKKKTPNIAYQGEKTGGRHESCNKLVIYRNKQSFKFVMSKSIDFQLISRESKFLMKLLLCMP